LFSRPVTTVTLNTKVCKSCKPKAQGSKFTAKNLKNETKTFKTINNFPAPVAALRGFAGCEKDDNYNNIDRIIGKWQLLKEGTCGSATEKVTIEFITDSVFILSFY